MDINEDIKKIMNDDWKQKICDELKEKIKDKTNEEILEIYNLCISLRQKQMSKSGNLFEKYIENILIKNNINYKKQVNIDKNGIIIRGTKSDHRIDFVIGDIENEKNIRNLIVLSTKKTCRERWRQDDWTLKIKPKKYLLLTLSDDYPDSFKFNENKDRKIITSIESKNDDRKYKLNYNDLINEIKIIKYIDLFCGIGSFHYSFNKLGFKCVMACDILKPAIKTYEKNYGIKPLGDIVNINPEDIEQYDILCAGFPCQPFSNIGQHKGMDDERGTLFFEIMKFVKYHKPKIIILENVGGLLKHDNGKTFNKIKNEIEKEDYNVEYKILKCDDYGIPQMRKRLFIVGSLKELQLKNMLDFQNIKTKTLSNFLNKNFIKKIAYTIRCGGRLSPLDNKHNWDGYIVDGKEYRLTIDDCLKLQGFNDFELSGTTNEKYKMVGNTIPTNFTKIIGEKIKSILI